MQYLNSNEANIYLTFFFLATKYSYTTFFLNFLFALSQLSTNPTL